MKYGIREICDVVFKAKTNMKVGNRIFHKDEPVIYFDSLKTSSLEGAVTTVYATGGRGNARLIAWDGERTLTFNMEDALISPVGFMILSGAGLIEASRDNKIKVHATERVILEQGADETFTFELGETPYAPTDAEEDYIFAMIMEKDNEHDNEPLIPTVTGNVCTLQKSATINGREYTIDDDMWAKLKAGDAILVDYYVEKTSGVSQIEITPDQFGGNFYVEASTLFRNELGVDVAAEFVIPNARVQSNFTFTMASTGDPSTFNFVLDAFPGYTRFDPTKKVLCLLQIVEGVETQIERRESTVSQLHGQM